MQLARTVRVPIRATFGPIGSPLTLQDAAQALAADLENALATVRRLSGTASVVSVTPQHLRAMLVISAVDDEHARYVELTDVIPILCNALHGGELSPGAHGLCARVLNEYLKMPQPVQELRCITQSMSYALTAARVTDDAAQAFAATVLNAITAGGEDAHRHADTLDILMSSIQQPAYHEGHYVPWLIKRVHELSANPDFSPYTGELLLSSLGPAAAFFIHTALRSEQITDELADETRGLIEALRVERHVPPVRAEGLRMLGRKIDMAVYSRHPSIRHYQAFLAEFPNRNASFGELVAGCRPVCTSVVDDPKFRARMLRVGETSLIEQMRDQLSEIVSLDAVYGELYLNSDMESVGERIRCRHVGDIRERLESDPHFPQHQVDDDCTAHLSLLPKTFAEAFARKVACTTAISELEAELRGRAALPVTRILPD